jgi:hypothetical protein
VDRAGRGGHNAQPYSLAVSSEATPLVDLAKLPTRQLLALWAQTLKTLHDRGVVRTFNNPIGDIAEELVAVHYAGERGSFSQSSWDVRTAEGELLQVKALRRTGARTRRNLSPVRSDNYTAVIVVVFTEDLRVEQAIRVPQPVVSELFKVRRHVNGRIITVTQRLLSHPAVAIFELSDALLDAPVKV